MDRAKNNLDMSTPAIEIAGLTKDYPVGFWRKRMRRSLDDLNLKVEDGETFGFLGPNGAGKTTTLKLLMGLIFPTSGTARVRGRSIDDVNMHREIGYLPEQPYFYDYLTARELLDYYARFSGYSRAERRERVGRFLEVVGLRDAADLQLRKFSKGMLQRVGFAQAILHDPPVIFLDEPMSGLDPLGRREVRDVILDLKRQGRTVFFSTHILSDAEMLCDRVAVVVGGKLQGVGAPGDFVSPEVQGMEILFEAGESALPAALAQRAMQTGGRYRIEVPEAELHAALADLRGCEARILSVLPIRPSLEDYFLRLVNRRELAPRSVEVAAQ
ncbi:MAG TPA: ABC transporter ATP-binding protein [Candidatus Acidoferrales bacterium]|nr:ABC transporter ATP-binding protein [Candidatus Acidoferrales bacterium]